MNADFIRQILAAMQHNAQGNVPVIPNNGNPMGANNMPSMTDANGEDNATKLYPWMRPSQSMTRLQQLIGSMGTGGNGQVQQAPPAMATGGNAPAMPIPGNTGIVPPNMSTNTPAVPVATPMTNLPGHFQGSGVVLPQYGQYGQGRTYVR